MALYSDKVMDHFQNPRNVGKMDDADGVGEVGNAKCGDIMKIYLKIDDGIITDVKFNTFGCGSAIATSSMATELIKGKKVEDALELSNKAVVEALDGLPAHKIHCPSLQRKLLQRQSRITMTATALRTIPSCSARSCTIVKAAQNNQNVEKAPHTGSFLHVKYYFPASGRQCMRRVSSILKPSACRHSLRAPKSSERSLRYSAIAFALAAAIGKLALVAVEYRR